MITSIHLINFQAHKNTFVDFTKGLNIIEGSNFSNKSGIVRAIKWVLLNRPRGDHFKSHFADKKEPVSVSITFDKIITVTRERRGKDNLYRIENQDESIEFKALGTDVPDEIKEILQMNEINIQCQGDPYFMLGEKPGTRAKIINKIVGLEIIDDSIRQITKIVNENESTIKTLDKELLEAKVKVKDFVDMEEKDKIIKDIDNLLNSIDSQREEYNELAEIIEDLIINRDNLEKINEWLKIEKDFKAIEELYDNVEDLKWQKEEIEKNINEIKSNREKRKKLKSFLGIEKQLNFVENLLKEKEGKEKRLRRLQEITKEIKDNKIISTAKTKLINQINEKFKEIGVCPTCGQTLEF